MCNHPYFASTVFRKEFRCRVIRPYTFIFMYVVDFLEKNKTNSVKYFVSIHEIVVNNMNLKYNTLLFLNMHFYKKNAVGGGITLRKCRFIL